MSNWLLAALSGFGQGYLGAKQAGYENKQRQIERDEERARYDQEFGLRKSQVKLQKKEFRQGKRLDAERDAEERRIRAGQEGDQLFALARTEPRESVRMELVRRGNALYNQAGRTELPAEMFKQDAFDALQTAKTVAGFGLPADAADRLVQSRTSPDAYNQAFGAPAPTQAPVPSLGAQPLQSPIQPDSTTPIWRQMMPQAQPNPWAPVGIPSQVLQPNASVARGGGFAGVYNPMLQSAQSKEQYTNALTGLHTANTNKVNIQSSLLQQQFDQDVREFESERELAFAKFGLAMKQAQTDEEYTNHKMALDNAKLALMRKAQINRDAASTLKERQFWADQANDLDETAFWELDAKRPNNAAAYRDTANTYRANAGLPTVTANQPGGTTGKGKPGNSKQFIHQMLATKDKATGEPIITGADVDDLRRQGMNDEQIAAFIRKSLSGKRRK